MGDREAAAVELREEGLDITQNRLARGRVAGMADGGEAFQALDGGPVGEVVAHEAQPALGVEDRTVVGDDARRLLAAMLQGMEAEGRDGGRFRVPVDAEDAAFFAQGIAVEVEVHLLRGDLPRL